MAPDPRADAGAAPYAHPPTPALCGAFVASILDPPFARFRWRIYHGGSIGKTGAAMRAAKLVVIVVIVASTIVSLTGCPLSIRHTITATSSAHWYHRSVG